jgi:type III restriction enzyme
VNIVLKPFQEAARDSVVTQLRAAWREVRVGIPQAVVLSAPTASGKTVIATAALERLVHGDETTTGDEGAVVLWLTDLPELNEQTRRRMREYSSEFTPDDLIVVDTDFDAERLTPGRIYFLNTQKLVTGRTLVTNGDDRSFTFWETIANTTADPARHLFCVIDEAHRGMAEGVDRELASSIMQKFIKGSPGEVTPLPVVLGISATPERFARLISGAVRITRPVPVPIDEVRESGLLKERVSLYHPKEAQPSDMTLLRRSATDWRTFSSRWATYCAAEGEVPVEPILIVQVLDGDKDLLTKTHLAEVITAIREEVGALPDVALAHAFQEGEAVTIGTSLLRYIAPADIDRDPDVRVVFFKTSLNVGWDCPRAEVMMSFRRAVDATHIAQLVGRMVRTPLRRRIDADEYLNSVALYLPHYNKLELDRVIKHLTEATDGLIDIDEPGVTLNKRTGSDESFASLETLPSYLVPRARQVSEIHRLGQFARALELDDLDADAETREMAGLADYLIAAHGRLATDTSYTEAIAERGTLEVRRLDVDPLGEVGAEETIPITVSSENIGDLFEAAGRQLGEGLHRVYWRRRVATDPAAVASGRIELVALIARPDELAAIQTAAKKRTNELLAALEKPIAALSEARRQIYDRIKGTPGVPTLTHLTYYPEVVYPLSEFAYKTHLYADEHGDAPIRINTWEQTVVAREVARDDHVSWLRNPDRKPWSFTVPYDIEPGDPRPMFPDLLFLRRLPDNSLGVDLIDPHLPTLADAPAKAIGLAEYAALHGACFERIELAIVDHGVVKSLNLKDADTRKQVLKVSSNPHLVALFDVL